MINVYVTWTAIELGEPASEPPWAPVGAVFTQGGHASAGHVRVPDFSGYWWSVLGVWDEVPTVAPPASGLGVWHVVLEAVSYHGDAVLSGGATPFRALPERGKVDGAAAVITMSGVSTDPERSSEFYGRVGPLGQHVSEAEGHLAALVQSPPDGAGLTFSAWRTLRDAVSWAYHQPEHSATIRRQQEHQLLATSGFLRCAVVSSSGTLLGRDPLAGLTGVPVSPLP